MDLHGAGEPAGVLPDDADGGGVGEIDGIETLGLLGRVSAIVVAFLPELAAGNLPCKTAPAPEIEAGELPSGFRRFRYPREHVRIVPVPAAYRSAFLEGETVARVAEFLYHERLAQPAGEGEVPVDVFVGLHDGSVHAAGDVTFLDPAPVVGPDVDGHIVDVVAAVDPFHELHALLATHQAFVAGGNHVHRVDGLDERGGAVDEGHERIPDRRYVAEAAGLVGDLPGEDGGGVLVSGNNGADVVEEEFLRPGIGDESADELHVWAVALRPGVGGGAFADPLEVGAVAAGPFPGVVEVEDRGHVAFLELLEEVSQSLEAFTVVFAGGLVPGRTDLGVLPALPVGHCEDAEIGHSERLQGVELRRKPCAALLRGCEDGTVPEVGSDVVLGLSVADETAVAYAVGRFRGAAAQQEREEETDAG